MDECQTLASHENLRENGAVADAVRIALGQRLRSGRRPPVRLPQLPAPPGRAGVACWAEAGQGPARAAHSPPAPPVAWAPGSFLDLSGAPAPPLQGEGDPTSPAECHEGPVWHTGAWYTLSAELVKWQL